MKINLIMVGLNMFLFCLFYMDFVKNILNVVVIFII